MNILFVCRQNVGRSQMAMGLHNYVHPGEACSAGTLVDKPGQLLRDFPARDTIAAMKEMGIDVSGSRRTPVTPEMLGWFDKIVVMSEPENTPHWLSSHPKAERWTLPDTKDSSLEETRIVRDDLARRIASL